jgi:hypothetical protein
MNKGFLTFRAITNYMIRAISLLLFSVIPFCLPAQSLTTRFEQSNGNKTPAYHEIISWWKMLDAKATRVTHYTSLLFPTIRISIQAAFVKRTSESS